MTKLVFLSVYCYFILQIRLQYFKLDLETCYKQSGRKLVLYRLVHNHRRRELVGRPFGPPGQPNLGPCPFLEGRSRSSYIES